MRVSSSVLAFTLLLLPFAAMAADKNATTAGNEALERLTRMMLEHEDKLRGLEADVRSLRGEIEVFAHKLDQGSQSERNIYADLDDRLRKMEQNLSALPPVSTDPLSSMGGMSGMDSMSGMADNSLQTDLATDTRTLVNSDTTGMTGMAGMTDGKSATKPENTATSTASLPVLPGNPRDAYQSAFNYLQSGEYYPAINAFRAFLQQYPQGEYADNAQYWLGESYYALRDYRSAQEAFQAVASNYPNSQKRPHAELKLGYVLYELGDKAKARELLEQVRLQYPSSSTSRLAEERLRRMQLEGY